MKYIALDRSVVRCRPEAPLTHLHNDCGAQDRCARRLAANLQGDPTRDWSKVASPYSTLMLCNRFVSIENAPYARETHDAKPMQAPT